MVGQVRRFLAFAGVVAVIGAAGCTPAPGQVTTTTTEPGTGLNEVQVQFALTEFGFLESSPPEIEYGAWMPMTASLIGTIPIDGDRYPQGATMTMLAEVSGGGPCLFNGQGLVGCSPPSAFDVCWRVADTTRSIPVTASDVCETVTVPQDRPLLLAEIEFPLPRLPDMALRVERLVRGAPQCNEIGCTSLYAARLFPTAVVQW
jgi:hypothetical protein